MPNHDTIPLPADADLIFFDDFSLGQLDRTKWNVRTTGRVVNNEQQAYVDSVETIYIADDEETAGAENKVLVIQAHHRPDFGTADDQRFDFISGRIDTRERFEFQYGTASARMKLPTGPGLWPAFWAMGTGGWPTSGEIDIMEYVGEPDWVSCALHGPDYHGEAALVNKHFFQGAGDATSWHVYTVVWEPDRIVFQVDGATAYRVTRPMVDFFGPWVFDNRKFLILNLALGGVYPFKTNGIVAPYYGISQATAEAIKANQARVIIDWVRVDVIQ